MKDDGNGGQRNIRLSVRGNAWLRDRKKKKMLWGKEKRRKKPTKRAEAVFGKRGGGN